MLFFVTFTNFFQNFLYTPNTHPPPETVSRMANATAREKRMTFVEFVVVRVSHKLFAIAIKTFLYLPVQVLVQKLIAKH